MNAVIFTFVVLVAGLGEEILVLKEVQQGLQLVGVESWLRRGPRVFSLHELRL